MKWELGLWQDTWGRTKPNPKSLKNEVGLENSRDEKDLTTDRKVGRKIGFPTTNIRLEFEKERLPDGVYLGGVEFDNKRYKAIVNYGARPTFSNDKIWTETHFISYMGDLYGKKLKIYFKKWLRGNRKFESAEALKNQLTEDVKRVMEND